MLTLGGVRCSWLALVAALGGGMSVPVATAATSHRPRHGHAKHHRHKKHRRATAVNGNRGVFAGRQLGWAPVAAKPLSDAAAAALVTRTAEIRPDNAAANRYVPSDAELNAAHAAPDEHGQRADVTNPLRAYVTGRPGLRNPSTDDLMQWAAHKWGIPEDWIRADAVVETDWHQAGLGDRTTVSAAWYAQYPTQAQVPGTSDVFQSMGLMQVRWQPDGSLDTGTEPLRWKSTAFNLDFYGATVRWYYDGLCGWCTSGYGPGQGWSSIGAWNEPYPWNNAHATAYIATVQQRLAERTWAQPGY